MRTPRTQSRVTHGTGLFMRLVPRTPEWRRFSDLLERAEAERGGREAMTITAQEAARAWAMLAVLMEQLHATAAEGETVDLEALGQIGDRMDRQARRMGPVKAPLRPTLEQRYPARKA